MGSGGLAVDAMAIGCLGVERRGERFFRTKPFFVEAAQRLELRKMHILGIFGYNGSWTGPF